MDYTVAAVDEAIGLLFLVAASPGLGVTELAKRSGNTKPRAFRLLSTLESRNLVRRQGDSPVYCLSFNALHLGAAAKEQIDLVRLVEEPIKSLGAMFNEMVIVRVRDGMETLCVARWESTHAVRVFGEIGNRRPIYVGASGKLLLANSSDEFRQSVFAAERTRFTPQTLVSDKQLQREIVRIRAQGYATSLGEHVADVRSIAVPIRDANAAVIATLGISAPSSRMTETALLACLPALQAAAVAVSSALGHAG